MVGNATKDNDSSYLFNGRSSYKHTMTLMKKVLCRAKMEGGDERIGQGSDCSYLCCLTCHSCSEAKGCHQPTTKHKKPPAYH